MSAALNAPLLAPEQASKLLDDVLYARVMECIDVQKLFMLEVDLWVALCEHAGITEDRARVDARITMNRLLSRLAADDERYGAIHPFGMDCPDCEEEAAENARKRRRSS